MICTLEVSVNETGTEIDWPGCSVTPFPTIEIVGYVLTVVCALLTATPLGRAVSSTDYGPVTALVPLFIREMVPL